MKRSVLPLLVLTLIMTAGDPPAANAGSRGFWSGFRAWFGFGSSSSKVRKQSRNTLRRLERSTPTDPAAPVEQSLLQAATRRTATQHSVTPVSITSLEGLIEETEVPVASKPTVAPAPIGPRRWQRDLERDRDTANSGGRGSVFLRSKLLAEVKAGKRRMLGFDQSGGARDGQDDKSKFVLVEAFDHSSDIPHLLAVASGPGFQPTHLFDVPAKEAATVGGMVRSALQAHAQMPTRQSTWIASVSLPGKLTIPVLHVHGEPHVHAGMGDTGSSQIADWDAFAVKNGYRQTARAAGTGYKVYVPEKDAVDHWEVIVVADSEAVLPAKLTPEHDDLLGRMYLDGANEYLGKSDRAPYGYIETTRDDQRLVVRVVAR